MRVIAIGCEYSGGTTLLTNLLEWGHQRGVPFHLDAHEQRAILDMLQDIKERFQRFQVVYHVRLINHYDHVLLGGFHIEEEIYGPLYYYPA